MSRRHALLRDLAAIAVLLGDGELLHVALAIVVPAWASTMRRPDDAPRGSE
jgi:hypothetical protein